MNKQLIAYNYIKNLIFDNKISNGDYLIQENISKALKISRTPTIKALVALEAEGLLEATAKGLRVKKIEHKDIEEIYEARALIEKKCIDTLCKNKTGLTKEMLSISKKMSSCEKGKAFLKLSLEFHNEILKASNNNMLITIYNNMQGLVNISSYLLYDNLYNVIGDKIANHISSAHKDIVKSLKDNNAVMAINHYFFGYK